MSYAPILLTVYDRPDHTKAVLEALAQNKLAKESDLFVYSDGAKEHNKENIDSVRRILRNVEGFRKVTVIESPNNKGLARSVIEAVSDIIEDFGKIIVLEDDLITQKNFLNVMNQMLDFYEEDENIGSVTAFMQSSRLVNFPSGYTEDVFFNVRPTSWGWGTWRDRWRKVNWEITKNDEIFHNPRLQKEFKKGGKDLLPMLKGQVNGDIDSWAIRWTYHHFVHNLVAAQVTSSYIDNIGYDSSGVNCKKEDYFFKQENLAKKESLELIPFDGKIRYDLIRRYYLHNGLSWPFIKKKISSKLGITIKF